MSDLDKQERVERQKTLRAILWIVALLIVAGILFGVYRTVTAPVRSVQNTTETVTQVVEETATAVLTRRHIGVAQGRRFARLSDAAFDVLADLPETAPTDLRERTFRIAHLRGSQNRVCRFEMDFGSGPVPVWAAADNAEYAANRSLGGQAHRQIRLVWETPGVVLGITAKYAAQYTDADDAPRWELLWRRRDSMDKPLTDAVISARALETLAAIPEQCSTPTP